jgi:hypothetical protein
MAGEKAFFLYIHDPPAQLEEEGPAQPKKAFFTGTAQ